MLFQLHRPQRALALSLGILTLSACAGTTPVAPTAAEQVSPPAAPAATPPSEAPAAAVAPVVQPQAAPFVLQGTASFGGEPFAGAQVAVLNAATDAPLSTAGDGLRLESAPSVTDAAGGFRLALLGASDGPIVKLVASKGGRRLEALVPLETPSTALRVLAEPTQTIDEVSTAETYLLNNLVRASRGLKPAAARPVLQSAIAKVRAHRAKLHSALNATPNLFGALTAWSANGANEQTRVGMVDMLLGNASIKQEVAQDVLASALDLGEAASREENRAQGADWKFEPLTLPGTPLKIDPDPDTGRLNVTNVYTNAQVTSASDANARSAALRRPSRSRKERPAAQYVSKAAISDGTEQFDDESQLLVSETLLNNTVATTYHLSTLPFVGITFALAPEGDDGYALTLKVDGVNDRTFHFVKAGESTYRLVRYDSFRGPIRSSIEVDPEISSSQPITNEFTGVTQSYHFKEPDTANENYVYDIHFSATKLEGFTLYNTGAKVWSVVSGAPIPIVLPPVTPEGT